MHVRMISCSLLLFAGLAGCSIVSSTSSVSAVELPGPSVQDLAVQLDVNGKPCPIDLNQFQPGSYCRLETKPTGQDSANQSIAVNGASTSATHDSTRIVAGRIVAVEADKIVLADAISISSRPSKPIAIPTTTRILAYAFYAPMAPRLFKVSGVGRETIAIPGEVTIERASIRNLQPVDGTNWAQFQNGGLWFERFGADFDSNTAPSEDGDKPL